MANHNGKTNRRRFIKGVGAAGIVGLSGCSSNGGNGDTTTTGTTVGDSGNDITVLHFTDSWIPKGQLAPIYHALNTGMYAERNLSVQTSRGYGSGETAKAVGTGKTDIGFAGVTAVANVIKEGLDDLVWISPLQPNTITGIFVGPNKDITELSDIEGRPGTRAPGDVSWVVGQAVFEKENIDISGVEWEVTFSGPQLILEDQVDFLLEWGVNAPMFWYGEERHELDFLDFRNYTSVFGNGFVTRKGYLEENPEAVRQFLDAVYTSYTDVITGGMPAVRDAVDSLFKYYSEMATGEGGRQFHLANLQLWLYYLLNDSVAEHGLGYLNPDVADSSVDLINEYLLDDSIQKSTLMKTDDKLVESGDYTIPNIDSHRERLQTIQPGDIENPLG